MAHFAKIENGTVTQVIVVSNEDAPGEFPNSELYGIAFCKSLFGIETEWVQTSYNSNFRYNYAGVGYTYDVINDAFIAPKPFDSWILNETNFKWEAPIPYPEDGAVYYWDEIGLKWIEII